MTDGKPNTGNAIQKLAAVHHIYFPVLLKNRDEFGKNLLYQSLGSGCIRLLFNNIRCISAFSS